MKALRADQQTITLDTSLEAPLLEPTSAHLLVRVLTCALNTGDAKFLSGALRSAAAPFTPGLEICGVVEAMGAKAAASGAFRSGDRVAAVLRPPNTSMALAHGGGLAQFVVVEAALAAVVPPSVSAEQAVALPLAGTVALQAIKDVGVTTGSRVLVLGASSDVGRMVVQLAKHAGAAFVAGTAPRKELVASLPLDLAIVDDNQSPKWYDALSGRDDKLNVVVDCVGEPNGRRHADNVLAARGSVYAVLVGELVTDGDVKATTELLALGVAILWKSFWRSGQKLQVVGQFPTAATLRELLALVETNQLTLALDASTPLAFTPEAVTQALARLSTHQQTGKLVVQIPQEQ